MFPEFCCLGKNKTDRGRILFEDDQDELVSPKYYRENVRSRLRHKDCSVSCTGKEKQQVKSNKMHVVFFNEKRNTCHR